MTTMTPLAKMPLRMVRTRAGWRRLGWHYLEMVAAMAVGMLVLGMLRGTLGLAVPFRDRPGLAFVLMATDMSIGMAIWMRVRRHGWPITLQMCAAMYVPLLLLPLVAAGAVGVMAFMVVAHVVMCVGMLVVLLARPEHS